MALDTVTLRAGLRSRLIAALPGPTLALLYDAARNTHRIYSHVPEGTPYPYVRIGDLTVTDTSAKDSDMHEVEVMIHAFSRTTESPVAVETLLRDIYAALHNQEAAVPLATGRLVFLRCEFQTSYQERTPNDTYWHGVQRYRAFTQGI
jgi:hypothetical protein